MKQNNNNNLIHSIAAVEMVVGNIFQAKNFFSNALKFKHVATKKTEDSLSCLMKQGQIHVILTSSLSGDSLLTQHLNNYGDSIKKLSFWVSDAARCVENTLAKGAKLSSDLSQRDGVVSATIEVFNYVEHEFLEGNPQQKIPGFDYEERETEEAPMIFNIDHIASCHPANNIEKWVEFYRDCFGFSENKNEDIYSEESGMHIIIMKSPNGLVNLPLVEPSSDKSPLHHYLKYNLGAGVHHIAFETNDIIAAVEHYEENHGELRKALAGYFQDMKTAYPDQHDMIDALQPHGIMLEKDDKGILFQIFTKPVVTRPTLFLEFIQRQVCEGFGTVNIKALYDTLEEEKISHAG